MLWTPEIDLDIETAAGDTGLTIPFKDILTNLSFGFMGELPRNWKWLRLMTQGMYDFGLSWKLWRSLSLFTWSRVAQVAVQRSGSKVM